LHWLLILEHGKDDKSQRRWARALDLFIKNFADDPEIDPTLRNLNYVYYSVKAEDLLRAVLAKNPAKDVKGIACLKLGEFLKMDAEGIRQLKEGSEEGKRMESFLSKETVVKLKDADADKVAKEAEAVFEEAVAKYGDVYFYTNPRTMKRLTIGDIAAVELFGIRNLSVGKTAPDIAGDDLDGKPFKLSDYRGKVVVLTFWGNWSPSSRSMYAEERSLVKRLEDKPFALVGVNSDADKDQLKKIVEDEHITWRSFWDGPEGVYGPISTKWNTGWPTTYVIDAKGMIRFKNVRGEDMDRAVDRLLREMEKDGK
jgi:peroxiredoxin